MYVDPSTSGHRPASATTQDISTCHVLRSVFQDVYSNDISGKNHFSNMVKTKNGRDNFHCRHVEELQQAFSEYNQCMKETETVKDHLIQARAQAAAKETFAFRRMAENLGDISEHQELFIVKSAFPWCVDENLLKANDLISPRDYIPTQEPRSRAADKYNLASPTKTHATSMIKEPQNEGLTPTKEKTNFSMRDSDHNLTVDSNSDIQRGKRDFKKNVAQTKPRPKWKDEPSALDRSEGVKEVQKLKDRQNYLRNPRFRLRTAEEGGVSLIQRRRHGKTKHPSKTSEEQSSSEDSPVFVAKPPVLSFTEYKVGHIYETTLELRNVSSTSRHVRVLPPNSPYFSIGLGRFPSEEGVIAPGMSCKYSLRFTPDSLSDYKDFLVVETQAEQVLLVPIEAVRPPPILTLPRVLDCGYCLVGGLKYVEFLCQNIGRSAGTFCIVPKSQWPFSSLRSLSRTYFSEQPPFAVGPSLFQLDPGDTTVVEVVFFPNAAQKSQQTYTVVCDNCQVKDFSIQGEGQLVALEFVSAGKELPEVGEVHDITAEHYVRFDVCNPYSVLRKTLVIRNNVHLDLPFQWQIRQPNLNPQPPGEIPKLSQIHAATDDAFQISPVTGLLPPCQDQEFLLTFSPKELKDYHSVCRLVLRDVPHPASEPSESSILETDSQLHSVIAMEIEVKGSTEPYQILLEPYAVIIPGEIFVCTTTRRQFKMWNHSKTFILFQWEKLKSRYHRIEVEPSTGRIEENECFDFDLILLGEKPEKLQTNLICKIEHHHQPVILPVEVSFKGPTVTLNVPTVDFGLMRLGELTHRSVELTNNTQLDAFWTLKEKVEPQEGQVTQISVEPCCGRLLPLASCSVDVIIRPQFCQKFEALLELEVENGQGCLLWIEADVQSPQVCLLNCKLTFSELYLGVPQSTSVKLLNQTALPAKFRWASQLHGKHSSFCCASFVPDSGVLEPNASLEVTVQFTSHADMDLSEVAALCEVEGMNLPLLLGIAASNPKKLCVSYWLPDDGSLLSDPCASSLVLDFGRDVMLKRPVTRQLLITNQTAIAALFVIEVENFPCNVPNTEPEQRCSKVRTKLQTMKAEKLEIKMQEEFVNQLLAVGRGAAFHVVPDSGLLGPFETQTVAVTAFADMWGEYSDNLICKVGDLEAEVIPLRMTVGGCPLYFQVTGPKTDDQFQGPIIRFGTHIPGGDTVSRPLRINNASSFDIRLDWETYNIDKDNRKLVDVVLAFGDPFPPTDADASKKMRRLSERNVQTTLGPNGTSCRATAQEDDDNKEEDCVKKKLVSVHIRPHVGNLSDYPFCITPQQIVIPAKSGATFHVSFTPLTPSESATDSRCSGLALGFLSLDSETAACVPGKVRRAQGLELQPVRMDLQAALKPAELLVELQEEEKEVLEFEASAGDLLKVVLHKELVVGEFDVSQTFRLRNPSDVTVRFRMETEPPFSVFRAKQGVCSSSSSSSTAVGTLVLQPRDTMQVTVAFHSTVHLINQAEDKIPPDTEEENGLKRLMFKQNLLIQHSNNTLQTVPLCAHVLLSTLSLSTDRLSFGVCYVGETESREITLTCRGSHTYWMSTSDSRDAHVFKVSPDFGLLRPKEPRGTCSSKQHLQISFTPSEDREFRAVLIIQAPLVKPPLTLELRGTGTLDGKSRSVSELSPVSI